MTVYDGPALKLKENSRSLKNKMRPITREWDKNHMVLKDYHKARRAYYEKRAGKFLARAKILKKKGIS